MAGTALVKDGLSTVVMNHADDVLQWLSGVVGTSSKRELPPAGIVPERFAYLASAEYHPGTTPTSQLAITHNSVSSTNANSRPMPPIT